MGGRGPKTSRWVLSLYAEWRIEFDRLQSIGVKFNISLLQTLAVDLIKSAETGSDHHISVRHKGKSILNVIKIRWAQRFMQKNSIVSRCQSGKLMVSPEKREQIENEVAFHLGTLKRGFELGTIDEDFIENADETHFLVNMDNGRT